jgi:hypothetical protein
MKNIAQKALPQKRAGKYETLLLGNIGDNIIVLDATKNVSIRKMGIAISH